MVRALINRKLKPEPQPEPQPKPAKPLALELLKKGSIDPQSSSPLFNFIPKEIRDLIFEHALTAYPDPARPYGSDQRYVRPGVAGHLRVATELLLVCKAIYIETYQLPITLNPVLAYHGFADDVPPHAQRGLDNLRRLAPWQYAALHMIDISMQQTQLEGYTLSGYARQLHAEERYEGARVSAEIPMPPGQPRAKHGKFVLLTHTDLQKLDSSSTPEASSAHFRERERLSGLQLPPSDPTVARVIDKLTLRLGRTEWWTWEDPPFPGGQYPQLMLDPGMKGINPGFMQHQAEQRRRGLWTGWQGDCWGAQIAEFKGLRCLELVLETFTAKKQQLDAVIECAKTWRFPMEDDCALVWDGNVEISSWTGGGAYGYE